MKAIIDIPNLNMPQATTIKEALEQLPFAAKADLFEKMTQDEFVEHRVDIFLEEIERALLSGEYSYAGAEEIARQECMHGLEGKYSEE